MPFVQAKCPECGGMLAVDDSKKAANCQFCGEAFIVQEAVNNYITNNITNNNNDNRVSHNYGDGAVVNVYENQNSVSALIERAFMFLEDGNFANADEYCEKALDIEPENAQAYLGKLMAEYGLRKQDDFKELAIPFYNSNNFKKILRFGDNSLKSDLTSYIEIVKKREEEIQIALMRQEDIARKEAIEKEELARQKAKEAFINKVKHSVYLSGRISAGYDKTAIISAGEGTVIATNSKYNGKIDKPEWTNIVAVSVGWSYLIGLKSDGTVVSIGNNKHGRCNVSAWTDIVAISADYEHTVGLKSNGTVVATGNNKYGQCNVEHWTDIVAISAGQVHTVGLKSDGTVVATGYNKQGQCNVENWTDIVAVSAGQEHTVGLKSDGTVVTTVVYDSFIHPGVSRWTDIVAISAGYENYTVGLKSDGTVFATNFKDINNVFDWSDIVAISAGADHVVGLTSSGKAVTKGSNVYGQCNVNHLSVFHDINNPEKIEQIDDVLKHGRNRAAGLCQHCGGEFKGLFSKKCAKCGKPKDY